MRWAVQMGVSAIGGIVCWIIEEDAAPIDVQECRAVCLLKEFSGQYFIGSS